MDRTGRFDPGMELEPDLVDELLSRLSAPMQGHSRRVAVCSAIMAEHAREFSQILDMPPGANLTGIAHLGGLCHDIGKLLFPALATTGTDYYRHPAYGADLLDRYKGSLFESEAEARMVLDTVRYHHEQPDGGGFPYGLRTRNIPLSAGICAVADGLDHRIFSDQALSKSSDAVFGDIKVQEGTTLYESAVACFERAWPRLMEQYIKWTRSQERRTI